MHAPHPDDGSLHVAEATIGAVRLGIPAAAVVQAIPAPERTTLLPRRQGALSGIVDHAGALVPVVDLGRWVDVGNAPAAGPRPQILVLRAGACLLGLRVDAVGGIIEAAPGAVTRLYRDDDPDEVFHSALRGPEGAILGLLDVERLAMLAAAWSDAAGLATGAAGAPVSESDEAAAALQPYALLRADGTRLGVPAGDLAEVVPMPPLERIGGGMKGAYCTWRGRHLSVLASADFLPAGLASQELQESQKTGAAPLLAVLEHGGLALGVPVHAALQLASFDPALAVPAEPDCFAAAFDADGPVHLLDTARLFARRPDAGLSRPEDAAPAARQDGLAAHNEVAYIVFEADGMQAVPIDGVEQVAALAAPAPATLEWQGRAIPVADLRGTADPEAGAHLMVVRDGDRHLACVVTRVHVLIPPRGGRLYRMGGKGGQPLEFITTGSGPEQASYRTVDLAARAAARHAA
nr:chemotaxis protein CheW [uncultured Massilia sp.]